MHRLRVRFRAGNALLRRTDAGPLGAARHRGMSLQVPVGRITATPSWVSGQPPAARAGAGAIGIQRGATRIDR